MKKSIVLVLFVFGLVALCCPDIFAASTTGDLPFEGPLEKLVNSLTGPVAFFISLAGIFVAGGVLLFGGDLQGFARTMIQVVLVIAVLVNASSIMTNFFGKSATVPVIETVQHD